jgi:hypothetical protein
MNKLMHCTITASRPWMALTRIRPFSKPVHSALRSQQERSSLRTPGGGSDGSIQP